MNILGLLPSSEDLFGTYLITSDTELQPKKEKSSTGHMHMKKSQIIYFCCWICVIRSLMIVPTPHFLYHMYDIFQSCDQLTKGKQATYGRSHPTKTIPALCGYPTSKGLLGINGAVYPCKLLVSLQNNDSMSTYFKPLYQGRKLLIFFDTWIDMHTCCFSISQAFSTHSIYHPVNHRDRRKIF